MIKQYLLSPGPTPIPNEVALAMAETMVHHRTPQGVEIERVFPVRFVPLTGGR